MADLSYAIGFGTGSSLFGAKTTSNAFAGFGTSTQSQAGTGLFGNTGSGTSGIFGATSNAFGTGTNTQSKIFCGDIFYLVLPLWPTIVE